MRLSRGYAETKTDEFLLVAYDITPEVKERAAKAVSRRSLK